jgi:CheY-like chemotaxis protein
MEDEPSIRELINELLTLAGFTVQQVGDASAGLRILQSSNVDANQAFPAKCDHLRYSGDSALVVHPRVRTITRNNHQN